MFTWTLFLSIALVIGMVVGLYVSPDTGTLMLIVLVSTFIVYGYNRYWRHPEGFLN